MPMFVVQEHHATHLYFDFRLEIDGVLKSWAIPKGPSMNPKDKRLAIMVDDHTLEYATYEGIIPAGQYGSGAVVIWDRGDYELASGSIAEGRLEFILKGKKLRGRFLLTKMSGKIKEWLLIKKRDGFAQMAYVTESMLTQKFQKRLKIKVPPGNASLIKENRSFGSEKHLSIFSPASCVIDPVLSLQNFLQISQPRYRVLPLHNHDYLDNYSCRDLLV